MNNNRLIAQALLEIAQRSETSFIEVGEKDKEIIAAAKKLGLVLPSPDLAVFKTIYAEINKVNKNGIVLSKKAVEKGLNTLIGKQCNWEHNGSGYVCGYTISVKINKDTIETINVLFKSLFLNQIEELKEKVKSGEAAVSFEIYNKDPNTGKSVVKELANGYKEIDPIIFHGTGVLLVHQPAYPKAKIFKLIANKLTQTADKVMNKVFSPDLIYAGLALENKEESKFECICLKCGKVISSDKHCKDIKCPACGGDMRRKDHPGKGQPQKANEVKVIIKQIEVEEWICPHCEKAIEEKELFHDVKIQKWYHRPCQEKGEIILPKDDKKEGKIVEEKKKDIDIKKEEKPSEETKTEVKAEETKTEETSKDKTETKVEEPKVEEKTEEKSKVVETKSEDTKVDETKEETKAKETEVEAKTNPEDKKEDVVKEKTKESKAEETTEEKKDENKVKESEVIELKVIVKITGILSETTVSTFVNGTPSGEDKIKGHYKKITEYSDGTKDEFEKDVKIEKKYTFSELEEAVNKAKEELTKLHEAELEAKTNEVRAELDEKIKDKEKEISNLKKELGQKTQETEKAKEEETTSPEPEVEVGDVTQKEVSETKTRANKVNEIIAEKNKNR